MATVDKKLLEHLADLSRIGTKDGGRKLLTDIREIVSYVEQLAPVDMEGSSTSFQRKEVELPSLPSNVMRDDAYAAGRCLDGAAALLAFPDTDEGYLNVPKVQ